MLKVNDSIRSAYKQKTTQRKSYIKVGDNSFFIQNLDVSADAYDEGNVIGNAIAKIAKFDIETEYVKGLDEFELFDGIWTGEKYEYVSLGTFKLFEEQGTDEFFSSITSYDKLVLFNKPYDNTNVNFPISLYDFLKEICSQANVELETKRIANGDKILFQNLFVEGETLKQILKAICQISGNFAKIKNDKLVLGLYDYDSYITTSNEIVLEDVVEEKTKFKQYGYTKQDGTPTPDAPVEIEVGRGKNLFNKDLYTYDYVSKNNTGNMEGYKDIPIYVGKANTTYFVSTNFLNGYTPYGKNAMYVLISKNKTSNDGYVSIGHTHYEPNNATYNKTTISDGNGYLYFRVYNSLIKELYEELMANAEVQIEEGTKKTNYLPYNTIESKSNGKNLLSEKTETATNTYFYKDNGFKIKAGITYTLSCDTLCAGMYVRKMDNTDLFVAYNKTVFTFTPTEDTLVYFNFYYTDTNSKSTKYQLELGDVATEYQEHQESSITYNLGDNFLADKDYIQDGVLNKNIGKVVLNGRENGWGKHTSSTDTLHIYWLLNADFNNIFLNCKVGDENTLEIDSKCNLFRWENFATRQPNTYSVYNLATASWLVVNTEIPTLEEFLAFLNENPMTLTYPLEATEQIPSETTGELRTFEPYTIISNDLDSEMEVEYGKYIEIKKDELYQPEYKRTTWKLNKVVLGMKDVEGEFVSKQDDVDVEENGTHQLVINDNPFVYTQQLREEYIGELFERIKGFGYVAFESGFEGVPYYELGDLIKIEDKKSIILRYNLQSPKGLESTFSAPSIIDSVVEYTQTPSILEQKIRSTELRVDKAEGNIIGITKQTTEIRDNLNKNYYTIEQANTLIQNAETGVTNTFSEAGGNNVFRNTGLWFKNSGEDAETNPYEFWEGKANEGSNDKATNYRSILLGKGSFIQDTEVPNGNYSISFYYRKLISNAVASVVINGKEYTLDSLETKQFYTGEQNSETGEYIIDPIVVTNNHIKIEFKCDALDGVEVYDLMCNKGSVKLAYSQNQNETTTDTVNISKGITITSSDDKNTKFKADYDGIRILDGNNNPKTTFTDKGTETDELVVRKKATITGLLHQEVDDQTWVTKI